jgi:DNA-binding response OmpR family regulator
VPANTPLRIALIEDHKSLREVFADYLQGEGHTVFSGSCAEDLDSYYATDAADLLILDVNLPGEDGLSVANRYRNAHPSVHILMLTVRAGAKDRVSGYENGADIYLPKPVSADELGAAVRGIARRVTLSQASKGQPQLDFRKKLIFKDLTQISLSEVESTLLKGLIEAPQNTLDYWHLLELIHREPTDKNKNVLGVYIHRLSKKLTEVGLPEPTIKAVWKKGYQLTEKIQIIE